MRTVCLGLVLLSVGLALASPARGDEGRPNIVWIIVDDMSANFSCYGEKAIQTPNVDRLGAKGCGSARRS